MEMNNTRNSTQRKRVKTSGHARLMQSALRKLEAVPKGERNPYAVLIQDEYDAAIETLRAAIRFSHTSVRTQSRPIHPKIFLVFGRTLSPCQFRWYSWPPVHLGS